MPEWLVVRLLVDGRTQVSQAKAKREMWRSRQTESENQRKSDQLSQFHIALLSPNTGLVMSHLSSENPGHPSKQQN